MARDTTLELDCGNACDVGHNTRRVEGYTTVGGESHGGAVVCAIGSHAESREFDSRIRHDPLSPLFVCLFTNPQPGGGLT